MIRHFGAVLAILDEQVRRMRAVSFVVSDQTGTVEVTMNGQRHLTDLFIDPGILGFGARELTDRINEAIAAATDLAEEWFEADLGDLETRVADALAKLRDLPGVDS